MTDTAEVRLDKFLLKATGVSLTNESNLTPRERACIVLFYGTEASLKDIGKQFGVTSVRVAQIIEKGMHKLNRDVYARIMDLSVSASIDDDRPFTPLIPKASVRTLNCVCRDLIARKIALTAQNVSIEMIVDAYPDAEQLRNIRNLGPKTFTELVNIVHDAGYKFKFETEVNE